MKNMKTALATIALFFYLHTTAQTPEFKLFLIGDAGDEETTGQTLDSLGSQLNRNPNSAVVFLGDNSYSHAFFGLAGTGWKGFDSTTHTEHRVRSQLGILDNYKGSVYFVPGNHDWWNVINMRKGKHNLKLEENFVTKNLVQNPNIKNPEKTYLPQNGEPGPAAVDLNNGKIKLICIDSYWLIISNFKKNHAMVAQAEKNFYHNLDSVMAEATAKHQLIVIASHHPVYGEGLEKRHKHFFFPPRIEQQNMSFYAYRNMIEQMVPILKKYPGVYYATGHIHAMQYHYTTDNIHYIISGAGSKLHHLSKKDVAKVKPCTDRDCNLWNEKGFFELDCYPGTQKVIIHYDEGKKQRNF